LEYAVLKVPPRPTDLVFIRHPIRKFTAIQDLGSHCEDAAGSSMIYEVWLAEVLLHAYAVSKSLSETDADRFIKFFKTSQGIDDEEELAAEAILAVREARRELYGDKFA